MKFYKSVVLFIVISFTIVGCRIKLEPVEILTFQQKIEKLFPNAEVSEMEVKDHFTRVYQIVLDQPLDHKNPEAGTFKHYLYLSHVDVAKPTVIITEGYNAVPRTYELSKIFKGKSKVENGHFIFDFVAPKDIKIAFGKGKLSFYANNKVINKGGYNLDITIGGINENAPEDTNGPTIQLYMNDLNFVEGGNTNESPLFIAVLEDENGINTSITAVDHDIIAILDGDQSNPIVLNDYFQTELNNYKKGKVSYPFRSLSPGLHTITLKAWDTYNNLSETSFTFFVVSDSDLVLTNVLNYPNPFVNYTQFWFNHNKPNELLNVQVQIFTVSGKLVKTINEAFQTEGNLSNSIVWNGLDDFGSKIGKGVYIYKLKVKSLNSSISAQKIEKLVILQ